MKLLTLIDSILKRFIRLPLSSFLFSFSSLLVFSFSWLCLFVFSLSFYGGFNFADASSGYRSISLKSMIRQSELIVIVKKKPELTTEIRIPFLNPSSSQSPLPPYRFFLKSHHVLDVLYSRRSVNVRSKETLQIAPAHTSNKFDLHRRYHLQGVRKIPLFKRYKSTFTRKKTTSIPQSKTQSKTPTQSSSMDSLVDSDKKIYFLRQCSIKNRKYWCFTASKAYESIQFLEEIKQLIPR